MAKHIAENDNKNLNTVFNTTLFFFTVCGLILLAVSVILPGKLIQWLKIDESDTALFKNVFLLLGITAAAVFPSRVFSAVLQAKEKWAITGLVSISLNLARRISSILVLIFIPGIMGLAVVFAAGELLSLVINIIIVKKISPEIKISPALFDKRKLRPLLTFGFFAVIISLGDILRFQIDETVAAKFLSMEAVATYAVAAQLFRHIFTLSIATFSPTQPAFTRIAAQGQKVLAGKFIE